MRKRIYDEKNGLSYTLHGDYYLPDLEINEEEPTYGKYGIMRKQFLKEHRSARYQYLVLTGKLMEHMNQVDKEVREKVEMLMEQMAEQCFDQRNVFHLQLTALLHISLQIGCHNIMGFLWKHIGKNRNNTFSAQ